MLCTKNVELFMKVSVHDLKALTTLEQENISVAEKNKESLGEKFRWGGEVIGRLTFIVCKQPCDMKAMK